MQKADLQMYPASMRALHWAVVLLVLTAVVLGFVQEDAGVSRIWLLRAHLLVGSLVVATTLVRLFVRRTAKPAPLPMPRWRSLLMRSVHGMLYISLILLGLSGMGTGAAGGLGPVVLGAEQSIPQLEGLIPREIHVTLVFVFLVSVGLHVAGVLAYQAQQGDALGRMLGRALPSGGGDRPDAAPTPPAQGADR